MAKKKGKHKIRIVGHGNLGQLLSQHLLNDKSSRQDLKVIEKLTGVSLQAPGKRTRKYKI